ncbi:hypothetical protein BDL97_12G017300 [Sphagnum fallax]|nr:hypothetical protein BDL97_12G017300 [Sphagnum fallax]
MWFGLWVECAEGKVAGMATSECVAMRRLAMASLIVCARRQGIQARFQMTATSESLGAGFFASVIHMNGPCSSSNGQRWMATGRKKSENGGGGGGGGGGAPSLFDQWLALNPLPQTSLDDVLRSSSDADSVVMLERLQQSPTSPGIQSSSYGRLKPLMEEEEEEEEEEEQARERGEVAGASRDLESSLWVSEIEQEAEFWNGSFSDGASDSGNGSVWSVLGVEQRGKRWDVNTKHGDQDGQRRQYRRFSWVDTADVLYQCLCDYGQMVWDNKHKCFLQVNTSEGAEPILVVPPMIQQPTQSSCTPSEYLKVLRERKDGEATTRMLLALVSSSAAALGVFHDDVLVLHKVVTAYTVRAKQGKAQLHYLSQGGPGRMSVGGGLRARETRRLFTHICEKLNEWHKEIEGCNLLFYSGNMRVWNEGPHYWLFLLLLISLHPRFMHAITQEC